MKQMTIRVEDPAVERGIETLCRRRDWSANRAAVYLLRKGLGLNHGEALERIGSDLDAFIGSWTQAEAEAFDQVIAAEFDRIDDDAEL